MTLQPVRYVILSRAQKTLRFPLTYISASRQLELRGEIPIKVRSSSISRRTLPGLEYHFDANSCNDDELNRKDAHRNTEKDVTWYPLLQTKELLKICIHGQLAAGPKIPFRVRQLMKFVHTILHFFFHDFTALLYYSVFHISLDNCDVSEAGRLIDICVIVGASNNQY